MGFIKDFIQNYFLNSPEERRRSKISREAYDLAEQGRYAEAAEVNARHALEELKDSDLMYSLYCIYAFEMWIKAQEPGEALREARNVLRVYINEDGKWLKYGSAYPDNLMAMVSQFFAAGYAAEAAVFAGEVNRELEKYELPVRCAAVPVRKNIFPVSCSDCGANLSHNPYQETAQCSYCRAIVYAVNSPAQTADGEAEQD